MTQQGGTGFEPYGQPQYGQPQYGQPQYGQAPYGQPQYGQAPYGPPPPPPDNGDGNKARLFGALVFVIGILAGIPALIFGFRGLGKANRGVATNKGSAIFGIVMGCLSVVGAVVLVLALVGAAAGPSYSGTKLAGDVTTALDGSGTPASNVSCADTPHVKAGATTACHGDVGDQPVQLLVTWNDRKGHFRVAVQ
jgi:hypothetical protein